MVEVGAETTRVGFERAARQPGDAVAELFEQRSEAPVELVAPSAAPAIDDLLERPVDVDPHTAPVEHVEVLERDVDEVR